MPSPNYDERPADLAVDLLVLHYISLPPGYFAGDAIEQFFCNSLDFSAHPSFEQLRELRVSSHFLISRHGRLTQFVALGQRAWHAGISRFRGRTACNDFSVGIELQGDAHRPFTNAQYRKLAWVVGALREQLPLEHVAGHSDIAPGRKFDPGPQFDWARFMREPTVHGLTRFIDTA